MEAVIKKLNSLSFSTFVSLFFADKDFNLLGKQAANRSIPPGGNDFGLAQSTFIQTDRDILFMGISGHCHLTRYTCSTHFTTGEILGNLGQGGLNE
ncbi:MAG: hypothetical protein ABSD63_00870 [Candidatus Korobacteraceae bacterium]